MQEGVGRPLKRGSIFVVRIGIIKGTLDFMSVPLIIPILFPWGKTK